MNPYTLWLTVRFKIKAARRERAHCLARKANTGTGAYSKPGKYNKNIKLSNKESTLPSQHYPPITIFTVYIKMCVLFLLAGCSTTHITNQNSEITLPSSTYLPCCWQKQEQLDISYNGKNFLLTSAVAVNNNELTIIILDPLNRLLTTIKHTNDTLQVKNHQENVPELPINQLLLGVYLRHLTIPQWKNINHKWKVLKEDTTHHLFYNGSPIIEWTKDSQGINFLKYHNLKIRLKITTLIHQPI